MQRISVNLTNDCDGNQLNYKNDLSAIRIKIMHYRNLSKELSTVIGNAKLRPSFVIFSVAQGSRPHCGPKHPILHSKIFFMLNYWQQLFYREIH